MKKKLKTIIKEIGKEGCFSRPSKLKCRKCPIFNVCFIEAKLRMFNVQPTTITKGGKVK